MACEASSSVASCSQVPKLQESHGHFLLIQFGLKRSILLKKIYMHRAPDAKPLQKTLGSRKCKITLPGIFMICILHHTRMEITGL